MAARCARVAPTAALCPAAQARARVPDEEKFLGPHSIRSVSRWHAEHPYVIKVGGQEYSVGNRPAESDTGMFGGNSNWRGPVWSPINVMLIRGLLNLHIFFGDDFAVECPTGSGRQLNLYEVAREISDRLTGTFLKDAGGHRPVRSGQAILQTDPTGATWCCSMSTSTAITGPASAQATRPAGPAQ